MKAKELKKILNRLKPEQLEQELYINISDTPLKKILFVEVIKHSYVLFDGTVWRHGAVGGPNDGPAPKEWDKGQIHIHVDNL